MLGILSRNSSGQHEKELGLYHLLQVTLSFNYLDFLQINICMVLT